MGAGRAGRFSGLRRRLLGGVTDVLDVVGLLLIVLGVWRVLGSGFALLAAGAAVLLISRGLYLKKLKQRPAGSEVA